MTTNCMYYMWTEVCNFNSVLVVRIQRICGLSSGGCACSRHAPVRRLTSGIAEVVQMQWPYEDTEQLTGYVCTTAAFSGDRGHSNKVPYHSFMIATDNRDECPLNFPFWAGTGPIPTRCWLASGWYWLILAHNGMFRGVGKPYSPGLSMKAIAKLILIWNVWRGSFARELITTQLATPTATHPTGSET